MRAGSAGEDGGMVELRMDRTASGQGVEAELRGDFHVERKRRRWFAQRKVSWMRYRPHLKARLRGWQGREKTIKQWFHEFLPLLAHRNNSGRCCL